MASPKRASKRIGVDPKEGPRASRPYIPGYGIPKEKTGLLPWSHVSERMAEVSAKKYGYAPNVEEIGAGGSFVFIPRVVFAWKQFPRDATRWDFQDAGS